MKISSVVHSSSVEDDKERQGWNCKDDKDGVFLFSFASLS